MNIQTEPQIQCISLDRETQEIAKKLNSFYVGEIKERWCPGIPILEEEMPKITDSRTVYEFLKKIWEEDSLHLFESFYALYLKKNNEVCGWSQISKGGMAGTVADPKIIFRRALLCGAAAIIVAHNHPSGNLIASQADRNLTKKIKSAGQFLEIEILDHLILTPKSYTSMADEGII